MSCTCHTSIEGGGRPSVALNLTPIHTYRALRAGGCKGLRRLNLSSNELHAEGLRELLGAFLADACPELSDLGLASNCLGGWGGDASAYDGIVDPHICPSIRLTHCTKRVETVRTQTGVQGAMELGRALQHGFGPNLKRLSLASNNLGSLGLQVRHLVTYHPPTLPASIISPPRHQSPSHHTYICINI